MVHPIHSARVRTAPSDSLSCGHLNSFYMLLQPLWYLLQAACYSKSMASTYCCNRSRICSLHLDICCLSCVCAVPDPSAVTSSRYSSGSFADANSVILISPVTCSQDVTYPSRCRSLSEPDETVAAGRVCCPMCLCACTAPCCVAMPLATTRQHPYSSGKCTSVALVIGAHHGPSAALLSCTSES